MTTQTTVTLAPLNITYTVGTFEDLTYYYTTDQWGNLNLSVPTDFSRPVVNDFDLEYCGVHTNKHEAEMTVLTYANRQARGERVPLR